MTRQISQRQLRNDSGKIMRALDHGERFVVTRNGVAVGELGPARGRFVPRDVLVAAFSGAPRIVVTRFRRDIDRHLNQTPKPRA